MMPTVDLRAALARWFAEQTHAGVFATDRDLRITLWNRWMEIHTRRPAADVLGRPLLQLYPDLISRGLDGRYADALQDGRISTLSHALHGYVLPMAPTHADLGLLEMPQAARISPLNDGDAIVGTVTIVENVSERLASEAELRRQIEAQNLARATAERALREKDEFLSTLSHELRTPLNAVLGWTRIILSRKETHPGNVRALQVIERNAAAQAAMIDDILDVARVVTGKLRLEMAPTDVAAVVMAAIDVIMPSATAKRIAVTADIGEALPRVLGDPGRLQQIVWNLLSNAVKFSSPGGQVTVTLAAAGESVRLVVRDTGQGITGDFLPYVFDRFRQSDVSSARRQGGLGLGLALVRDLVHLHAGTIRAESEGEQRGAAFTIDLPALPATESVETIRAARATAEPRPLAGARMLIVEDEADSRDLLTTLLVQLGAEVAAVASSDEALAALTLDAASFDVLVSDIGMPEHDGYDLIRTVRALESSTASRIPAIAVTGYATPEDRERSLAAGYSAHIAKPIEPAELAAEVRRVLATAGR